MLTDRFGRQIDYLRLSVTDRCDFRCSYCFVDSDMVQKQDLLSDDQLFQLAQTFVGLGVRKIRITGGEPLVRKNIVPLLARIAALEHLEHLVLTTNGSQLKKLAFPLAQAGVKRLNISLDTLDPTTFRRISPTGHLADVLAGIEQAQQAGFKRIRINTVLMRDINDGELETLADFALQRGFDIAFIEEMPMGQRPRHGSGFISNDEVLQRLQKTYALQAIAERSFGPARYFAVEGYSGRAALISPHSHNFCGDCNRVRVTASGWLYPCLGHNDAVHLLPALNSDNSQVQLQQAIVDCIEHSKPERHYFNPHTQVIEVVRAMAVTGG